MNSFQIPGHIFPVELKHRFINYQSFATSQIAYAESQAAQHTRLREALHALSYYKIININVLKDTQNHFINHSEQ